jgi:hypothetical protein
VVAALHSNVPSQEPASRRGLAGIAFAEATSNIQVGDIPKNILRADDTKISFLNRSEVTARNDRSVERHREPNSEEQTLGVPTTLIEESIPGLVAATKDLVPVFARHFSDVRLTCTRDTLEISATFRPPQQPVPAEGDVRNHHAIDPMQAGPMRVEQPAPVPVEQPSVAQVATSPAVTDGRKRKRIAVAGLAVVVLGVSLLGIWQKSGSNSDTTANTVEQKSTPLWGVTLDDALLEGWIDVKTSFDLPVGTVRSAIGLMQSNDKYPSAHDLHDLAKFPVQAGRAFSLLARANTASGEILNIRVLKDDLESRLMAGARFPDEAPGGRYSSLQRELYNNVVVLGVIDLFYRRQDDPAIREVLAAIRRDGPQQVQKQGA